MKHNLIEKFNDGTSVIANSPERIGTVIYCSTDTKEAKGESLLQRLMRLVLVTAGCFGVSYVLYLIWDDAFIVIVLLALFAIMNLFSCFIPFSGKEFFVGEKGFAVLSFRHQRTNVTERKEILFADVNQILRKSTRVYKNNAYTHTDYEYSFFNHQFRQIASFTYSGKDEDALTEFYELVQNVISNRIYDESVDRIRSGNGYVGFSLHKGGCWYKDYFRFYPHCVTIASEEYQKSDVQFFGFEQGVLKLRDRNYEYGLFKDKGRKENIEAEHIGNILVFYKFMQSFNTAR